MADRVVLHVGAMKSGTSYLQTRLFAQADALARRGVLVPGEQWRDQVAAVRAVLSATPGAGRARPWRRLAEQVNRTPGTAIVSMEYLGPARTEVADRVVGSFPDAEVHVVITARDLNRSIPAMWQETVQNGRSWTWAEYVADVARTRPGDRAAATDRTTPGGTFWRQQDVAEMVRRWGAASGRRVALVTLPPPGAPRGLLWDRFAAAAGFDPAGLADIAPVNESLGAASSLVLRRLNELLDEAGLPFPQGTQLRKRVLAKTVLAGRRAEEQPVGLAVADWVVAQSGQTVERLRSLGPELFGEWTDLTPVPVPGVDPAEVPDRLVADAAITGLAGIMVHTIRSPGTGGKGGQSDDAGAGDDGTEAVPSGRSRVVRRVRPRALHAARRWRPRPGRG